jgi:hypothetical protein
MSCEDERESDRLFSLLAEIFDLTCYKGVDFNDIMNSVSLEEALTDLRDWLKENVERKEDESTGS